MPIDQSIYDELVQFVLETISSPEYLVPLGIHVPNNPMLGSNFVKQYNSNNIKPGIYPISAPQGGVHYVGVRNENGTLYLGNGYPDDLKLRNSVGLNAQENHSHGLCQTFALMFYLRSENQLKPGDYVKNIPIGLNFLVNFINVDPSKRDRIWSFTALNNAIEKKYTLSNRKTILRRVLSCAEARSQKRGQIKYYSLKLIIEKILLSRDNMGNLGTWYTGYDTE
jgi:hypothetical protein